MGYVGIKIRTTGRFIEEMYEIELASNNLKIMWNCSPLPPKIWDHVWLEEIREECRGGARQNSKKDRRLKQNEKGKIQQFSKQGWQVSGAFNIKAFLISTAPPYLSKSQPYTLTVNTILKRKFYRRIPWWGWNCVEVIEHARG